MGRMPLSTRFCRTEEEFDTRVPSLEYARLIVRGAERSRMRTELETEVIHDRREWPREAVARTASPIAAASAAEAHPEASSIQDEHSAPGSVRDSAPGSSAVRT